MKTVTINLPDSVNEYELTIILAGMLLEKGRLSSGQAAELAGIGKLTLSRQLDDRVLVD